MSTVLDTTSTELLDGIRFAAQILGNADLDIDPKTMTVEELVFLHRSVSPLEKSVASLKGTVRDGLLDKQSDGVENGKGTITFDTPAGRVECRARRSVKFLPEKATEVLTAKALLPEAQDTVQTVVDVAGLVDALEALTTTLFSAGHVGLAGGVEDLINRYVKREQVLSEKKIEHLLKQGLITMPDVDAMHTVTTTYALYDTTPTVT